MDIVRQDKKLLFLYRGICFILLFYILYSLFLNFAFSDFAITYDVIFIQSFLCVGMLFVILLGKKLEIKSCFILIFLYQCLATFVLRELFYIFYNNPFGYGPMDSVTYHELGIAIKDMSLQKATSYLAESYNYDDYGFPLILRWAYKFFDSGKAGLNSVLVLNAIVVVFSSLFLYKLGLFFMKVSYAKLLMLLWGTQPYIVYLAPRGIKENFFLFCIMGAMYFCCLFQQKKTLWTFFLFIAFSVSTILFRMPIFYMLIFSFFLSWAIRIPSIQKNLLLFSLVGVMIICVSFRILVDYIGGDEQGMLFLDTFLSNRLSTFNDQSTAMGINIISGLIGPIPDIIGPVYKNNYFLYNFTVFFKICISGFFLVGSYYIIRNKEYKYFALLFYILMHTIMLVAVFWTMDTRYQLPQLPFVMLIALYGYSQISKYKLTHTFFFSGYALLVVTLIFFFNYRYISSI
ncbi:hypothetical protein [Parabacteroides pacaensis]|uniref:hypothetical protein n=1 Tax=Parabacteroides pacaensis TaxID=2086575 RepID=UPI000D0E73A3|nr:hypothetical protein [Parabacteroides pacaensis]